MKSLALSLLLALTAASACDDAPKGSPDAASSADVAPGPDGAAEADAAPDPDAAPAPDAAPDPDAAPTPDAVVLGYPLTVTLDATARVVDLRALPTEPVAGEPLVRLDTIVTAAFPEAALASVQLDDLRAADGFSAASKFTCDEALPTPGPDLALAAVDPNTGRTSWDESLAFPGCMHVNGLAEVVLSRP